MKCMNKEAFLIMSVVVAFSLSLTGQSSADSTLPASYYKESIPDFTQHQDNWGYYDSKGNWIWTFCGPTSAANSLFWMSYKYNLPKLSQWLDGTPYPDDSAMIDNIANVYMGFTDHGTYYDPPGGVSDKNFISGKRSYLDSRYPWLVQKYKNAGFSTDPTTGAITGVNGTPPTLEWIQTELYNCEDVEIGITYLKPSGGYYYPAGGHWMTLAGWNATQLCVHDPMLDIDTDPVWQDYPGTAFDHFAYDDYYTYGTASIKGTDFITLEYSSDLISVIDIAVSESIPVPGALVLGSIGLTFSGWLLRRRRALID